MDIAELGKSSDGPKIVILPRMVCPVFAKSVVREMVTMM